MPRRAYYAKPGQHSREKDNPYHLTKDKMLDFYEKQYYFENERADKIVSRLSLYVAIFAVTSSFIGYVIKNLTEQKQFPPYSLSLLLVCIACFSLLAALWNFRASWFGFTNNLLPRAQTIEDYKQQCIEHYKDFDGESDAEEVLYDAIYNYYVTTSTELSKTNDRKLDKLYWSSVFVTWSIFLTILAYAPMLVYENMEGFNAAETTTTTSSSNEERPGQ